MHLALTGWLIFMSSYIPRFLSAFLWLSAAGYLVSSARLFVPALRTDFAVYTFFGELVFMVWLLGWGSRLREPAETSPVLLETGRD